MTEFKITDCWTNDHAWVEAASLREALISRANELRASGARGHAGRPALPIPAKISHYSDGPMVDVSIAGVSCVGRRENIIR